MTNPSEEKGVKRPHIVTIKISCQSCNHKGGGVFFDLSTLKAVVLVYLIDLSVIIVNIVNLFF